MKKLFLVIFVFLVMQNIFAKNIFHVFNDNSEISENNKKQDNKFNIFDTSNVYLSAGLGLALQNIKIESENTTACNFSLSIGIGYLAAKDFDINASFEFDITTNNIFTFSFTPAIGYHLKLSDEWYYNPQFKLGFSFIKSFFGFSLLFNLASFEIAAGNRLIIEISALSLSFGTTSIEGVNGSVVAFRIGETSIAIKYFL